MSSGRFGSEDGSVRGPGIACSPSTCLLEAPRGSGGHPGGDLAWVTVEEPLQIAWTDTCQPSDLHGGESPLVEPLPDRCLAARENLGSLLYGQQFLHSIHYLLVRVGDTVCQVY